MYNVGKAGDLTDSSSGRVYEVFRFTTIEGKIRHVVRFTGGANPGLNFVGLKWHEFEIAAALVGSVLGQHAHAAVSDWGSNPARS